LVLLDTGGSREVDVVAFTEEEEGSEVDGRAGDTVVVDMKDDQEAVK
jgi:hypothetical protein